MNSRPACLPCSDGEFGFQRVVQRAGAADVAGAAGAGAHGARGGAGGLDDDRVAAHGEVVVGRPDEDPRAIGAPVPRKIFDLRLPAA